MWDNMWSKDPSVMVTIGWISMAEKRLPWHGKADYPARHLDFRRKVRDSLHTAVRMGGESFVTQYTPDCVADFLEIACELEAEGVLEDVVVISLAVADWGAVSADKLREAQFLFRRASAVIVPPPDWSRPDKELFLELSLSRPDLLISPVITGGDMELSVMRAMMKPKASVPFP